MGIEYKNIIDRSGTFAQLTTVGQLLPGQAGFCVDRLSILYRRRLDASTRPGELDEFAVGSAIGSAWYDGTSVPGSGLGLVGDYYLNTTNGDVYRKDGSLGWTIQGNIKGPQGIPGNDGDPGEPGPPGDSTQWLNGSGAPFGNIGNDGDYYLDVINGDVYSKTAGSWAVVANIMGPIGTILGTPYHHARYGATGGIGDSVVVEDDNGNLIHGPSNLISETDAHDNEVFGGNNSLGDGDNNSVHGYTNNVGNNSDRNHVVGDGNVFGGNNFNNSIDGDSNTVGAGVTNSNVTGNSNMVDSGNGQVIAGNNNRSRQSAQVIVGHNNDLSGPSNHAIGMRNYKGTDTPAETLQLGNDNRVSGPEAMAFGTDNYQGSETASATTMVGNNNQILNESSSSTAIGRDIMIDGKPSVVAIGKGLNIGSSEPTGVHVGIGSHGDLKIHGRLVDVSGVYGAVGKVIGFDVDGEMKVVDAGGGTDDKTVKTTTNDSTPNFLSSKIISSDGSVDISVSGGVGTDQKINLQASSTTSGAPNGQQLWEFATSNDSGPLPTTAGGTSPAGTRAYLFAAERTMTISKMRVWISQNGGNWVRLGIYSSTGVLLASASRFSPQIGITTVNLNTPVALIGGTLYYMAVWHDDATGNLHFLRISGRNTSSTSPLMQRYSLGTNPTDEMPSSLSTSGNPSQYRPWIMVSE